MNSAMVERVGEALREQCRAEFRSTWSYDVTWRLARAAIEAMKLQDPAEGVPGGIAFEDAFFGNTDTVFHALRDAWNTTIDAALATAEPESKDGWDV